MNNQFKMDMEIMMRFMGIAADKLQAEAEASPAETQPETPAPTRPVHRKVTWDEQ